MRITRRRVLAATFVVGTAAILLPAASAVAYISPPVVLLAEPQSPAVLVAKGAAVDVPVEYSCTTSTTGMYVTLQVTEKVGKGIASGNGGLNLPCDSATHRVLIRVPASAGGKAFAKGTAAVHTTMEGCLERNNTWRCGSDSLDRTVSIK